MSSRDVYLKKQPIMNLMRKDASYPEEIFGESFSRYYRENYQKIHTGTSQKYCEVIREIPIQNLGITDMVSLATKERITGIINNSDNEKESDLRVRAFEFKIKDWRKGLLQANRYKFFSHSSILVVPMDTYVNACSSIDTFKSLNVGLWGYDYGNNVIRKAFTPRPNKNYSNKYYNIFKKKAFDFFREAQPIL